MPTLASTKPVDAAALIQIAAQYLDPQVMDSRSSGEVAAVIVTAEGDQFYGLNIDVPCSMGYCAEAGAIGAMITARRSQIAQVVAVALDNGQIVVYPPCGRCREFMYQIDHRNADTHVVLAADRVVPLRSLLPERWN